MKKYKVITGTILIIAIIIGLTYGAYWLYFYSNQDDVTGKDYLSGSREKVHRLSLADKKNEVSELKQELEEVRKFQENRDIKRDETTELRYKLEEEQRNIAGTSKIPEYKVLDISKK